ncbi:MAG: hypothetical protein WC123_06000 [Bacilli bacterium]
MKDKKSNNKPVYFFLGFRLLEATFKRSSDEPIKSFGVKIIDSSFDDNTGIHVITTQFSMIINKEDESTFVFNSGYQVNDLEWYKSIDKEQIDALFFSVVFPYIREKIHSLTNDYRGSVDIPIIDLRHANLSEGATFTKEEN